MTAQIVLSVASNFADSFLPGDRADINWVIKCLYEYQTNPDPDFLFSELQQDICWEALRLQPDPSLWDISREEYEKALCVVNPVYLRIKNLQTSREISRVVD